MVDGGRKSLKHRLESNKAQCITNLHLPSPCCSGCTYPQSLAWSGHAWSPGQTCLSSSPFAENFPLFANIAVSEKIPFCWCVLPADRAVVVKLGWSATLMCCLCIMGDKKKALRKDMGMQLVAKTHSVRGKIWNMSPPELDKKNAVVSFVNFPLFLSKKYLWWTKMPYFWNLQMAVSTATNSNFWMDLIFML